MLPTENCWKIYMLGRWNVRIAAFHPRRVTNFFKLQVGRCTIEHSSDFLGKCILITWTHSGRANTHLFPFEFAVLHFTPLSVLVFAMFVLELAVESIGPHTHTQTCCCTSYKIRCNCQMQQRLTQVRIISQIPK